MSDFAEPCGAEASGAEGVSTAPFEISAADACRLRGMAFSGPDGPELPQFREDADSGCRHFGVLFDGALAGVISVVPQPAPWLPQLPALRFFALGIVPRARGRGVGRVLVAQARRHAEGAGARILWANARVASLGFYRALGFWTNGDGFVSAATGRASRHVALGLPE